jgi:CheY-like chemotaxis protein
MIAPMRATATARPLTAAGFDVRETATGRDALRLARLQTDVIVLDLALPDMDGFEVLRRLKAEATVNIPDPEDSRPRSGRASAASTGRGRRRLFQRALRSAVNRCCCASRAW